MNIKVLIEEHIVNEFEIEANNIDEAMAIAERMYYDGDLQVDPLTAPSCKLMAADDGSGLTEFVEF